MPVKGKRSLGDIERILKCADEVYGPENVSYYVIAGIDPIGEFRAGVKRLRPYARPQTFVLTPYNFVHERIYYHEAQIDRLRLILQARRSLLDTYGGPVPGGSNRSLFPLNATVALAGSAVGSN